MQRQAAATRERKVNDAELARQDGIRRAETRYRDAQAKEERKRRDQARKAREAHRKAYDDAARAPGGSRQRLRRTPDNPLVRLE